MDTNLIIIVAIALVLFFLIIKFAKKIIRFVLVIVLIAALALFGYLYLKSGLFNSEQYG